MDASADVSVLVASELFVKEFPLLTEPRPRHPPRQAVFRGIQGEVPASLKRAIRPWVPGLRGPLRKPSTSCQGIR